MRILRNGRHVEKTSDIRTAVAHKHSNANFFFRNNPLCRVFLFAG